MLRPGGLHYPAQWDIEQNGTLSTSIFLKTVEFNSPIDKDAFIIPDGVKEAYSTRLAAKPGDIRLGSPNRPIKEIVDGIVQIPGNFNTTIVRQDDGIVILEAPVSSAYSSKVIDEALRRYPGVPIKAAISTSDAWPHIGGVREYVARGIPLYILDRNEPILTRLIEAPHRTLPDTLQLHPRKADFKIVSAKTVVGKGRNRVELYPIRTETGERMLMAWFPDHRLLYASDLAQPFANGGWVDQYLSELNDAVKREGLNVEQAFAMHMTPFPWTELLAEITKASATNGN